MKILKCVQCALIIAFVRRYLSIIEQTGHIEALKAFTCILLIHSVVVHEYVEYIHIVFRQFLHVVMFVWRAIFAVLCLLFLLPRC